MLMAPEELEGRRRAREAVAAGGVASRRQRPQHKYAQVRGGTRRERRLLAVVAVLCVITLVLIITFAVVLRRYEIAQSYQIPYCDRPECITAGMEVLQSVDMSMDPCQDFYAFACGRWPRAHPLPERRASTSWFAERNDDLSRRVAEVMERNDTFNEPEPPVIELMRTLHKSCMDKDTTEQLGLGPMAEVLGRAGLTLAPPGAEVGGGEPAETMTLGASLGRAQRLLSLDVIIELSTTHDANNTMRVLRVAPAGPTLSLPGGLTGSGARPPSGLLSSLVPPPEEEEEAPAMEQLTAASLIKAQVAYIAAIVHTLAPELTLNQALTHATKIMLFEAQLAKLQEQVKQQNRATKTMNATFYELQKILDEGSGKENTLNLEDYVSKLSENLNHTMDYDNDVIFVSNVPLFKKIAKHIGDEGETSAKRYLWWRMVHTMTPYATAELRAIERQFLEALVGPRPRSPRSQACTRIVKSQLPNAVTLAMAKTHPLKEIISSVKEMLEDIRTAFKQLVRSAGWMDRRTQDATLEKMYAVTSYIGYPEWLNHPDMKHTYAGLVLEPTTFLMNVQRMKAYTVREILESLGVNDSAAGTDLWEGIDPIQVNAFYTRLSNAIVIPAGILQTPFCGRGHAALNYAAIGAILGHELTHGFDSEGRKYNKEGRRVSWWSRNSEVEYADRAECFVQQYNRFRLPGRLRVDGENTLAENIADNGGVREALRALRLFHRRHGEQPPPPGLAHFSPEQLFFIGFANLWCHASTPAYDGVAIKDKHSPSRFRVLGTVSNSPEFARVFNCPKRSPMNPPSKCIIW